MTTYGIPVWSTAMTTDNPAVAVGLRVRQALLDRGISQVQVAEALGIAQSQVSRRLAGSLAFDVVELATVARLCGVDAAEFLTEDVTA